METQAFFTGLKAGEPVTIGLFGVACFFQIDPVAVTVMPGFRGA
jgi:hypothetical protein